MLYIAVALYSCYDKIAHKANKACPTHYIPSHGAVTPLPAYTCQSMYSQPLKNRKMETKAIRGMIMCFMSNPPLLQVHIL